MCELAFILPVIEKAPVIVSTTSATISLQWNAWSAEDDIGDPPLVGYDVFVKKDGEWVIDQRVEQPTTSAIVSGLTPDTDYRFRVAAVREGTGGTGPLSPRNDTITLCRKPSASPTGLLVSATNPKELVVTWEHLASESAECRSGVTHYMIYYASTGLPPLNSFMVPNDTSSYTIRGLDTYLDYTIQITASNKDEESDRSSEIIGKTIEEVAPSPINVAIPQSTTSSFTLSWSTPLPSNINGNIQKYIIRYKQTDPVVDGDYKSEEVLTGAFQGEHTVVDLTAKTNYSVQVQTVNGAGSSNWSEPVTAETIQSGPVGPIAPAAGGAVGAILIILIIIIVVIIMFKRRRNDSNPSKKENIEDQFQAPVDFQDTPLEGNNYSGHASVSNRDQTPSRSTRPKPHVAVKPVVRQTKSLDLDSTDGSPDRSSSKPLGTRQPIPLAQFPAFVNKNRHTALYSEEFHDLPGPDIYPQTVAREEINFTKNRYKNILPYDSARVKLEVTDDIPHSDYFNASYIPSFDNDKAYIASQGPNKASMDDFWRMVWQENVTTIAMVTKLKEGDKIKCGKYWPNVPGDSVKFGNIKVELESLEACTGGVKRKMTLRKGDDYRIVTQFHFTEWPDKGVPKHTSSLLKFIMEVKADHGQYTHPLIIHCSAGVGRTGVVISIDSVVAHAKTTRMVDVFNFVKNIRQKRPYMVQTQEQYAFIYGAVLEDLLWRNTLIPIVHFTDHLQDLHSSGDGRGRSKMTKEFQTLKSLCPDPPASQTRSGRTRDNHPKNRYGNNLPLQRNRVMLDSPDHDYINASQMKGVHCTFMTTQMPLPTTVSDFWSLVLNNKPSTVVMLNDKSQNDKSCAQYWPDANSVQFGSYSVSTLSTSSDGDMTIRQLKVTRNSKTSHTVTQYQFHGWPKHGSDPQLGARSLMKLIR
ncbi:receptor-type tyrosine-protein phosphatase alpha-like, partial [Strongylocentrotus purpuratus]|uniref:protein-tyrosine-phosphatase n=1 Tax=Strongylocentrotus purpuratus TaxID=7668 RepID=A0A7M7PJL3_STRPU